MVVRNLREEEFEQNLNNGQSQKTTESAGGGVTNKVKEGFTRYGRKGLRPFGDLLSKYEGEISPYLKVIGEGLRKGAQGLEGTEDSGQGQTNTDARRLVASWFQEGANWFETAGEKIQSKNIDETLDYFEQESRNHPTLFFSMSYIAGAVIGRLAKHAKPDASVSEFRSGEDTQEFRRSNIADQDSGSRSFSTNR